VFDRYVKDRALYPLQDAARAHSLANGLRQRQLLGLAASEGPNGVPRAEVS
jgi:hypothetical protein